MNDNRLAWSGALALLLLPALLVVRLVTWYLNPAEVLINLPAGPRAVGASVVHYGELLQYWPGTDCKVLDVPGTLSRSFVGQLIFQTPARATDRQVGCRSVDDTEGVEIPNLPPGRYRLVITLSYRVNPLRDVIYRYETAEFLVVALGTS